MTEQLVFPLLSVGAHEENSGRACIMEVVSWLAGEEWSDTPACVDPDLAIVGQSINDRLDDEHRPLLLNYVNRFIGTADLSVTLSEEVSDLERDPNEIVSAWYAINDLIGEHLKVVLAYDFPGHGVSSDPEAAAREKSILSDKFLIALDNLLTAIEAANEVTPEPVRTDQIEAIKELVG